MRAGAAAALLCALAFAACGGNGNGSAADEEEVRQTVAQLAGNDPAACDRVTGRFLDQLGLTRQQCRRSASDAAQKKVAVSAIDIEGDSATAVATDENRTTLQLVKQDGRWLVDGADVEPGAGEAGTDTTPEDTGTAADPSPDGGY